MLKCLSRAGWLRSSFFLLLATIWLLATEIANVQPAFAEPPVSGLLSATPLKSAPIVNEVPVGTPTMIEPTVQLDPLNSPHPIPWEWVMATHAEVRSTTGSGVRYYRSPSLISNDGRYAAYSRIQMQVQPEIFRCRVSSVMFVENLQTGDLQTIVASSPLADYPFAGGGGADVPGAIAILIPVSWNQAGDRILAREFEAMFSTSDMSDYAVIWDRHQNQTYTLSPVRSLYTHAVLLGWSQTYPDEVLFRAGNLGERSWPVWAVNLSGRTVAANQDKPLVFGQKVNNVWAGPQVHF